MSLDLMLLTLPEQPPERRATSRAALSFPCWYPSALPVVGFRKEKTLPASTSWLASRHPKRLFHFRWNSRFWIRCQFPGTGSRRSGSRHEATDHWCKEFLPQPWVSYLQQTFKFKNTHFPHLTLAFFLSLFLVLISNVKGCFAFRWLSSVTRTATFIHWVTFIPTLSAEVNH